MAPRTPRNGALGSKLYGWWVIRDAKAISPFKFDPTVREHILREIRPAPDEDAADRLIRLLEGTVAFFHEWQAFESDQPPASKMRRQWRALRDRADRLQAALGDLRWATRRDLAPHYCAKEVPSLPLLSAHKPEELSVLDVDLCNASAILDDVTHAIATYLDKVKPKKGGRRVLTARVAFIVEIADALDEHVPGAVPISTYEGGPFENIVAACLRAATGAVTGGLHRLVCDAVAAYRTPYRPAGVKTPST